MKKLNTHVLLPVLFVLALGVILFFQFKSYQSVKQLISSNEELMNEINYKNKFQLLQTQLATFDKLVREAVITKGAVEDQEIKYEIKLIDSTISFIDDNLPNEDVSELSDMLDSLVDVKIDNGIDILNEYVDKGKQMAELMVYDHNKSNTNELIIKTIKDLEKLSEQKVGTRVSEIDRNEKNAMWSNIMIAIGAILFLIFVMTYIFYKIKQQQRLIHALNISKDKEKKSARIKDEFLANMSHEIRTPLNGIIGFTSLLEREVLNEKASRLVSTIKASGTHLLDIVNEILDIAKIEEGMIRIEHSVFNLNQLLAFMEYSFGDRIREKGIQFQINYHATDIHLIEGDEYRLTQILNNLLSNALKFTSQGSILLEVNCKQRRDKTCMLEFIVADTGIGIANDQMSKIFERFEQGDTHITRNYGGTGLGLSIVKNLIELQQGSIEVKSEPGQGSRFIVLLPYSIADQLNEETTVSIATNEHGLKASKHILVVEDNTINQLLLEYWFNERNMPFLMAQHGREALSLAATHSFDLILLDIQMPGMDGYEVAHKLRNELHLTIPVIAMTANAMSNEKEKCLAAGMNDYLAKPIIESELFEFIEKYTARSAAHTIIDRQYIDQLSNGNLQFKKELLQQFMIQAPQELDQLKEAFQKQDASQIKSTAHSMKTTFGYLGIDAREMKELVEMEQANDVSDMHVQMNAIEILCKKVLEECGMILSAE